MRPLQITFVVSMGLMLVAISLRYWGFWMGWTINLALALYLSVIVIWLEFFWHW